eukprot:gene15033-16749_t
MAETDELFTLRSLYWIGNYQGAINEANGLHKVKPNLKDEKDEYVYRSFIGLGQYNIVLSEVSDSSSTPIGKRAIKLLAFYLNNPRNNKDAVFQQLKEWLSDPVAGQNKTLVLIAATIYLHEDNHKDAYRILKEGNGLEQTAFLVQLHLKIHRNDLAQKQLAKLKTIDEDSVLTMLCTAWIHMSNSKFQDAGYIFEELIDKYGSTSTLLNSLAVSKMQSGNFDEAEINLQEALTKNNGDADSLANIIIVSQHLHRSEEVINRYFSQLRLKAPNHPLITSLDNFSAAFDRVAATIN